MRLHIGTKLLSFITLSDDIFAYKLSSMTEIPEGAKLNYIEAEVEEGKLKLSYLQNSRTSDDPFNSPLRQTAKPVTVLKKLLIDADLPKLNNWIDKLKAYFAVPEHTITVVKGNDILDIYHEKNYIEGCGNSTLGQSCMRYSKSQPFIKFYAKNEKSVSGVALEIGGRVAARALIWNATHNRQKVSVLDRVYSQTAVLETILKDWARENCDFILDHTTKLFRNNKDKTEDYLDMYVGLTDSDGPYPYLDNFSMLMGQRLYSVYNPKIQSAGLKSTDGGCTSHKPAPGYTPNHVYCNRKQVWVPKDSAVLIRQTYISKEYTVVCRACNKLESKAAVRVVDDNGERINICNNHTFPVLIDGAFYNICSAHGCLYPALDAECRVCATAPKYCAYCVQAVTMYRRINNVIVCNNCQAPTNCSTCNEEMPTYLLHVSATDRLYCSSCRSLWSNCDDCGRSLEPNTVCPCAGDYVHCTTCTARVYYEDVLYPAGSEDGYCYACFNERGYECQYCSEYYLNDDVSAIANICDACYDYHGFTCTHCESPSISESGYANICAACVGALEFRCSRCSLYTINGSRETGICEVCSIN